MIYSLVVNVVVVVNWTEFGSLNQSLMVKSVVLETPPEELSLSRSEITQL